MFTQGRVFSVCLWRQIYLAKAWLNHNYALAVLKKRSADEGFGVYRSQVRFERRNRMMKLGELETGSSGYLWQPGYFMWGQSRELAVFITNIC